MKAKGSYLNVRGELVIDCAECAYGGNGADDDKCRWGGEVKRRGKGYCHSGMLMSKYEKPIWKGAL